jgi:general secretion pathway protein E
MRLIGEILLEISELDQASLEKGLALQQEKGGRIGEILLHQKAINEADLARALSLQLDLEFLQALPSDIDTDFTDQVPIHFLKKYKMVPLARSGGNCLVVADPFLFQAQDELRQLLGWDDAAIVVGPQSAIVNGISFAYDISRDTAEEVIQDLHEEDPDLIISEIEETGDLLDDTSNAPVIKLVNLMFSQAVRAGASDIHIEPFKSRVAIRQRVDGILYDMFTPPSHIQAALVSRIKVMARLNIAEKRLPQDGRTEIRIADKNIDVRVSTLPTAFGERVVLRLLDKSSVLLKLTDLGMTPERLKIFNKLIHAAHGIMLVTGPTGSGKTTTLYAALSTINNTDINIITVEDPVEYQMEGCGRTRTSSSSARSATWKRPRSPSRRRSPVTWSFPPCTPTIRPAPLPASSTWASSPSSSPRLSMPSWPSGWFEGSAGPAAKPFSRTANRLPASALPRKCWPGGPSIGTRGVPTASRQATAAARASSSCFSWTIG